MVSPGTRRRSASWFCDGSATQVVDLLKAEMADAGATLRLATPVLAVEKAADGFRVSSQGADVVCEALVVATGGKSIPKMGATGYGYQVAEQFGVGVVETRPGLAPLTFEAALLDRLKALAGVSLDVRVSCGKRRFEEGDAVHPSRPQRPGDPADLILLAAGRGDRGGPGPGRRCVRGAQASQG